jgi:phosphoribosylpyrophosphate synthetase
VRDIAVFSGSAHPELAAEVCAHLGVPLSPARVSRFANDCLEVQLQANCRERDVFPSSRSSLPSRSTSSSCSSCATRRAARPRAASPS